MASRSLVPVRPTTGNLVEGGIREQTRQVLRNLEALLEASASSRSHVLKVTVFLHDWRYFKEMNEVFAEFFADNPPARSTVQGERWPEGSLVAMEGLRSPGPIDSSEELVRVGDTIATLHQFPNQRGAIIAGEPRLRVIYA